MHKFNKKVLVYLLSGTLTLCPAVIATEHATIISEAHSGRTDSSGGHRDNKNASGLGSYHYHCDGNPAHLHDGGSCPYAPSSNASSDASASSGSENALKSGANDSPVSSVTSTDGITIQLSSGATIALSKDLIKITQDILNQNGYDCGTPDGVIGTQTRKSLEKFVSDYEDTDNTDHILIKMIADALDIR